MRREENGGPAEERPSSRRYEPRSVNLKDKNNSHALIVELVGSNNIILEVGTSTGYLTRIFRDLGNRVIGIEIDEEAAEVAEKYCDLMITGDVEELDLDEYLGPSSIDVAVFGDVLEHLRYPAAVLKKIKRYLKPQGRVVVSIPNVCHGDVLISLLKGDFRYTSMGLLDETHLRFFGLKNVLDLLAGSGYSVEEVRTTRHPVGETELRRDPEEVLGEIRRFIEALPNSDVYQFVFLARPSADPKSPPVPAADLKGIFDRSVEDLLREHEEPLRREVAEAMAKGQEASERVRVLSQDISERDGRIAGLLGDLEEARGRARSLDKAVSEREGRIEELGGELERTSERIQSLSQAISEGDARVVDLNERFMQSENRALQLENDINEMRRSIIWQLTMKYHNTIIERVLPHNSRGRKIYDRGLTNSRILINSGWKCLLKNYCDQIKSNKSMGDQWVSVVVICWNNKNYLNDSLSSICSQSYPYIEIILSDNGSSDGSVEFVKESFPNVRIIRNNRNLGFAEGNNRAMRQIVNENRSSFILILNPDTVVTPDFVEHLVEAAKENENIGAFAPKMLVMNKHNKISSAGGDCLLKCGDNISRKFYVDDEDGLDETEIVFGPSGAAAFYRVEMLKEIGLYDKFLFTYYEDVDLNFRIQKSGWGALYVPKAIVYHYHSASLNDFNKRKIYLLNRNKYIVILKNYPFKLIHCYYRDILRSYFAFATYCFKNSFRTLWIRIMLFVFLSIPIIAIKRFQLRKITDVDDYEILKIFIENHEKLMSSEKWVKSFNEYLKDLKGRDIK